ncbi:MULTISPECIES: hypothetical protein [Sporosarcina]|uniref:Uncharacterized protein n=1 Tax=Sporosarcina newyorkensis TaxID=759851 RepID=A0A1T4YPY7_9BACL|nr:hypothetical protein [Sporosarcina newyorkensis]SKB03753.1 hypothetical protein SAMN04244570_3265 [Sporosarcina newyorkensis]
MNFWKGESSQIEDLKNQWFSMEEAIEELALDGNKITESSFRREANRVDLNKEFAQIGKPQIKDEKLEGKGRPRKLYNRAFVEALRSFAISNTYVRVEEEPIDYFISNDWKDDIEVEFKEVMNNYLDNKHIYSAVDELTRIVGETIIQKYNAIIGQNKFLIHQNKKLEDSKEYYIGMYRGVEENANMLNNLAGFIKSDISESSAMLSKKEEYHIKLTLNINQQLEEILELLNDIKRSGK